MFLRPELARRNRTLLAAVSLVGLVVLTLTGCSSPESSSSPSPGIPVATATVESQTLEETLQAVGTLRAHQTVRLSPEIAGRIERIGFSEGGTVAEGEVLIQLDDATLKERYEARQHALEEARANLANARRTYERNQRLHRQDLISTQQLDDSEASFKTAQARVARLESEVQEAQERLDDASIQAPFTGAVGSREVDTGNYVQPGTQLTSLYKLDPLHVRFTVPERFLGRVHPGQSVRVHVSAYPDTPFTGNVYFVSPSVREQTRDLLVKARVPNPGLQLKPGVFARVELVVRTLTDRPVVPAEALISTREGYFVFTVRDRRAHRQPVTPGLRQPGRVAIRDGLRPGETVIRSGHMSVTDGDTVAVQSSGDTVASGEASP